MKKVLLPILLFSVVALLALPVFAYDYRDVNLTSNEIMQLDPIAEKILIASNSFYELEQSNNSTNVSKKSIEWEKAIQVFNFEPDAFIDTIQTVDWENSFSNRANIIWKIPIKDIIKAEETHHIYAVLSNPAQTNHNDIKYYVATTNPAGQSNADHMYMTNPIPQNINTTNASIYLASIDSFEIDFIIVKESENVTIIPFATRPDFIELNNGQAYTDKEVYNALSAYMEKIEPQLNLSIEDVKDISDVRPFFSLFLVILLFVGIGATALIIATQNSKSKKTTKTEPHKK